MKRTATVLALLVAGALLSAPADARRPADPSTKSKAVSPAILDAIAAEMKRALAEMRLPNAPAPYFIAYKITEVEVNDVAASLGAMTNRRGRHFVNIEAYVHVGDYQFDNSNFVAQGRESIDGTAATTLPLEATPKLARRAAWRATDAAFKEALAQINAKRDALRTGASGGVTKVPSYSKGKGIVDDKDVLVPALEPESRLRARAESLSKTFRGQKHIRDSRVAFTSFLERRWYINSEGMRAQDTRRVSGVLITATGQATDGQEVPVYMTRYGRTERDLPTDAELLTQTKTISDQVRQLSAAPLVDNYSGPVLFAGIGAVGAVRNMLALELTGTPIPVGLSANDSRRFGGSLIGRIGLKVAANNLTVVDDPTLQSESGRALIGSYKYDDEGVRAQRTEVIGRGKLKTLLMSRTPTAALASSNGHARLSMPGGIFRGSATNTVVRATGGKSRSQLERALMAEVREAGLSYGLIIEKFDDPAITANVDLSRLELLQMLRTLDQDAPPPAVLAYRLYRNGKRELVRGVQLRPVKVKEWKNVIAVGRKPTVKNFLASTDDPMVMRLRGVEEGFVPSSGIESSVSTPDLLFKELEVVRSTVGRRPAPLVPRP